MTMVASLPVQAAEPVKSFGLVLMQPDAVLQERVPSVRLLSDYIKAVEAAAGSVLRESGKGTPNSGFIVIAVRPGLQSKVWLDFDAPLSPALKAAMLERIGAVKPFSAQVGPVVFAMKVGLWGASAPAKQLPSPHEWAEASRKAGQALEIGDLVERIWRD